MADTCRKMPGVPAGASKSGLILEGCDDVWRMTATMVCAENDEEEGGGW